MIVLCKVSVLFCKTCANAILKRCSALKGRAELQQMLIDEADNFWYMNQISLCPLVNESSTDMR